MTSFRTATTALSRDLNRAAIFRTIVNSGPIARKTISERLGLSPATVTAVTRELIEQGLIRVAERAPSRGGRPALLLELVGGAANTFGVKIAPDHVVGVRTNLEAEIVESHLEPFDAGADDAIDRLGDVLAGWTSGESASPLLGIGVGVSGVFDVATGLLDSPLLGWRHVELAARLRERVGLPVFIDNDVNTLAVSEHLYGRGQGLSNFLTVTIGRGVGLGIVAGGDIYRGHRGGAGEFGHTAAVEDGPRCTCGKHGCLEAVVSEPALVAEARRLEILTRRQGSAKLLALAASGDLETRRLYRRAGAVLGRSVANLVNVLAPELVLVSGEGTEAWAFMEEGFRESYAATLFQPLRDVAVEVDPWDDTKWAVGAAALVLRATFSAPLDASDDDVRARLDALMRTAEVVA